MRCQICFNLGARCIKYEDKAHMRSHSEIHRTQMNDDADDPEKIFHFCFPNFAVDSFGNENATTKQKTIRKEETFVGGKNAGIEIVAQKLSEIKPRLHGPRYAMQRQVKQLYMKFGRDRKMACRLCSIDVCCGKDGLVSRFAIDHAVCRHSERNLFTCQYCSKGFKTLSGVISHIKSVHHKGATGGYVDLRQKYDSEITALLTECFEFEKEKQTHQSETRKISGSIDFMEMEENESRDKIRLEEVNGTDNKQPNQKKLKIQINRRNNSKAVRQHINQLYAKFGRDRKIACRLCSKDIYCGKIGSSVAVRHAIGCHFQKTLFTCRYCSIGYTKRDTMYKHIRKHHHQKSAVGGFVYHCEKYESQIMALLTKCFQVEEEKEVDQSQGGDVVSKIPNAKDENRGQMEIEKKISDTIVKTEDNAGSSSGNEAVRHYCYQCGFSTKYEMLLQKHRSLLHC